MPTIRFLMLMGLWAAGPADELIRRYEHFERQELAAAVTGTITGQITPGEKVRAVRAHDRELRMTYKGTYDRKTGKFSIPGLRTEAYYDLELILPAGRIIGVGLLPKDAAARKIAPAGKKKAPTEPFTPADEKEIRRKAETAPQFTNRNRVLALKGGDGPRRGFLWCTHVMEMIRDTDFHARKGDEIIYRLELWYWEKPYGGWSKLRNADVVIYRTRQSRSRLGGIWVNRRGKAPPIEYRISSKTLK